MQTPLQTVAHLLLLGLVVSPPERGRSLGKSLVSRGGGEGGEGGTRRAEGAPGTMQPLAVCVRFLGLLSQLPQTRLALALAGHLLPVNPHAVFPLCVCVSQGHQSCRIRAHPTPVQSHLN